MPDAFFTAATVEFLKEQREKSQTAIASFTAELAKAKGSRADHLRKRIAGAKTQIESIDAELARRSAA